MNGYIKIAEVSKKWGIGERRINTLCLEGRIEGAVKFGNTWAIPADAEKPKDDRIKSGKYIKNEDKATGILSSVEEVKTLMKIVDVNNLIDEI